MSKPELPIDYLVPEIAAHLRAHTLLVLQAAPGAGKTTRVPPALLSLDDREILVLEPRRLAARLAARFVSGELNQPVGETVGYQVRFEDVSSPRTRLRYLTEGVLTRRLLSDPTLKRTGTVVLDEFHERHLEGDLALALLRRLQRTSRPDLRIAVMSATLDAAPVAAYLGGARIFTSEGRQHPLEIQYTPHSAAPLEEQVSSALQRLGKLQGHVLVFLPGASEIRRAQTACAAIARRNGWAVLPLHGDQSPDEQDRAVAPSAVPKVILATNVAESSITIEGVAAVIDSGLARVAGHSNWSGLPALTVQNISQASANQRAGRAGRTGPGRAIRLYPLEDFVRRPAHDAAEITRADLAPAALLLHAMGLDGLNGVAWLDAPTPAAVRQSEDLLKLLGAFGTDGEEMARYPLHPRLARLIVEARRRGVAEDGCTVAALLSAGERLPARPAHATRSDLLALLESQWEPRTAQVVRQVRRIVNPARQNRRDEDALLISVLAAFPDRVAKRRRGDELLLAAGGSAQLAPSSTVTAEPFVVAVEAEDRREQGLPLVRLASGIEPEWLIDLFPDRIRELSQPVWNKAAERVESLSALLFGEIAIQESRGTPDPEAAAAMLAEKALEAGIERFADAGELNAWTERVRFAAQHGGPEMPDMRAALSAAAYGLKSFGELRDADVLSSLRQAIPRGGRQVLDEIAPERILLPGGRQVKVHYEAGQPPWIASRLQDFFGMKDTPRIARGKVPVVIRLLAPSQRPVQTTTDLAGFWTRLYPEIRKELSRRYPKHKWPEDPNRPA
ncbi:MAG TPA: ATP-dependent helicase HrpB [Candidatus Limnocylindrales bacterium]|nr:ATP-dependent helicase HrpB [Candidatus Limnocylindrales bacterium]